MRHRGQLAATASNPRRRRHGVSCVLRYPAAGRTCDGANAARGLRQIVGPGESAEAKHCTHRVGFARVGGGVPVDAGCDPRRFGLCIQRYRRHGSASLQRRSCPVGAAHGGPSCPSRMRCRVNRIASLLASGHPHCGRNRRRCSRCERWVIDPALPKRGHGRVPLASETLEPSTEHRREQRMRLDQGLPSAISAVFAIGFVEAQAPLRMAKPFRAEWGRTFALPVPMRVASDQAPRAGANDQEGVPRRSLRSSAAAAWRPAAATSPASSAVARDRGCQAGKMSP